jgi:uncharacterized protein (UPF0332 family)
MKKINLILKLINEKKISLIDASDEVSESYNNKSKTSLRAAKILLDQDLLEEAISMSYYSMYNKTNSLFRLIGIKCENHAAIIFLLKELFQIDNKEISFAKEERINKQYYTDFSITKQEVKQGILDAETFIGELDFFIDTLTEDKKIDYKQKFIDEYF